MGKRKNVNKRKQTHKERLDHYKERNKIVRDYSSTAKKKGRYGLLVMMSVVIIASVVVFYHMQ